MDYILERSPRARSLNRIECRAAGVCEEIITASGYGASGFRYFYAYLR